ncbi:MAG: potassium channel family protein, partial [Mollicutes bacterium PWAP]|nr:potassium channel family protein [Mollicutes bacterium PWAP]
IIYSLLKTFYERKKMVNKNKKESNFMNSMSKNKTSDDKKLLNAIIRSDITYKPKGKNKIAKKRNLKIWAIVYALIIFIVTAASVSTLGFSNDVQFKHSIIFSSIEITTLIILTIDLIIRWYTSEVSLKKGNWSYFIFPFTFIGIILIASLLPSLYLINIWTKKDISFFNTMSHLKFLRIFRLILLSNLIPGIKIFQNVIKKEKSILLTVFTIVVLSIIVFALVIFSIEHDAWVDSNGNYIGNGRDAENLKDWLSNNQNSLSNAQKDFFNGFQNNNIQPQEINGEIFVQNGSSSIVVSRNVGSFFDGIYFATISMTTIGYGDISPVLESGKAVVIVMAISGVAVLAIPTGIISGGFITEAKIMSKNKKSSKPKTSNS